MNEYTAIAPYYDKLNEGCPYDEYAHFILECAKRFGSATDDFVDFACGTGSLAIAMAKKCISVTGFDISDEELSVAEQKIRNENLKIHLLKSDMRSFRISKKFDFGACCMDSVNYLLTNGDVSEFLSSAYACINNGGIFIFDVNTEFRFKNIYADNAYVLETDDALCAWQNEYNAKTQKCKFYLSLFVKQKNGTYLRYDETHTEKMYKPSTLEKLISKNGFEIVAQYGSLDFSEPSGEDEKTYYVLRKSE